jgi:hypothetical protein
MNKNNLTVLVAAALLTLSSAGMANTMSKSEYKASKDKISAEYKAAKQIFAKLKQKAMKKLLRLN